MIRRSKCPVHGANRRVPVAWALSKFDAFKANELRPLNKSAFTLEAFDYRTASYVYRTFWGLYRSQEEQALLKCIGIGVLHKCETHESG